MVLRVIRFQAHELPLSYDGTSNNSVKSAIKEKAEPELIADKFLYAANAKEDYACG